MSMTREEAIEVLENGGWWDLLIPVTTIEGRIEDDKLHEAPDLALTVLRPVSRDQVEKVWRGEWDSNGPRDIVVYCKQCMMPQDIDTNFCHSCGAAMTDEAVQMVMERWKEAADSE